MIELPLIDGCLFIDNSTLELLTTCPRNLQYAFLDKKVLATDRPALAFGEAIHLALEHRYRSCGNEPVSPQVEEEQMQILQTFFAEHPVPLEEFRTLELAQQIIEKYNRHYLSEDFELLDDDGKPRVEQPFSVFLDNFACKNGVQCIACDGEGFITGIRCERCKGLGKVVAAYYTGKIDLPILYKGQLGNIDHKTASIMGTGFFEEMRMSAQQRGYCWALWKTSGKMPTFYDINAIHTRPAMNNGEAVKSRQGDKQVQPKKDFVRERIYIQPEQILEWETNTKALIEEFLWHHSRQYYPMKTKWCVGKYGRCQFYDVCSLPPGSREMMLNSGLYQTNEWSPLKKVL